MYYVHFTNTQRQILRLLYIMEKYWFVEYKFGVFSINHAWKEGATCFCVVCVPHLPLIRNIFIPPQDLLLAITVRGYMINSV